MSFEPRISMLLLIENVLAAASPNILCHRTCGRSKEGEKQWEIAQNVPAVHKGWGYSTNVGEVWKKWLSL